MGRVYREQITTYHVLESFARHGIQICCNTIPRHRYLILAPRLSCLQRSEPIFRYCEPTQVLNLTNLTPSNTCDCDRSQGIIQLGKCNILMPRSIWSSKVGIPQSRLTVLGFSALQRGHSPTTERGRPLRHRYIHRCYETAHMNNVCDRSEAIAMVDSL